MPNHHIITRAKQRCRHCKRDLPIGMDAYGSAKLPQCCDIEDCTAARTMGSHKDAKRYTRALLALAGMMDKRVGR